MLDLGANGFWLATSLGMQFRLGRMGLGILNWIVPQTRTRRYEELESTVFTACALTAEGSSRDAAAALKRIEKLAPHKDAAIGSAANRLIIERGVGKPVMPVGGQP